MGLKYGALSYRWCHQKASDAKTSFLLTSSVRLYYAIQNFVMSTVVASLDALRNFPEISLY